MPLCHTTQNLITQHAMRRGRGERSFWSRTYASGGCDRFAVTLLNKRPWSLGLYLYRRCGAVIPVFSSLAKHLTLFTKGCKWYHKVHCLERFSTEVEDSVNYALINSTNTACSKQSNKTKLIRLFLIYDRRR